MVRFKRILLFLITIICLSGLIICAFSEDYPIEDAVLIIDAGIRKKPSSSGKNVVKLSADTKLTVLGEIIGKDSETWYIVETYDGKMGYIQADCISLDGMTGDSDTTRSTERTSFASSVVTQMMTLTVSAKCSNKNHVGNEWSQSFSCDDVSVKGNNTKVEVIAGSVIIVSSEIVEQDKKPDVGYNTTSYIPTEDELKKGFTITHKVNVTENGGRYSGNTATWTVIYTFKPSK